MHSLTLPKNVCNLSGEIALPCNFCAPPPVFSYTPFPNMPKLFTFEHSAKQRLSISLSTTYKTMHHLLVDADKRSNLLNLKELLHYQDLFYILAYRDLRVRYAQTFLGLVWALL
jgi:hypothetical protein